MDNKNCYNCRNFQRYYTKGTKGFDKTGIGECSNKELIVNAEGGCEDFMAIANKENSDSLIRDVLNVWLEKNPLIREFLEKAEKGEKQ